MMNELDLVLRTADRARKAEVRAAETQTCGDLIQAALENWSLPPDTDYSIINVSKTPPQTLNPSADLVQAGVLPGETLEIQPVLVAGSG